MEKFTRIISLLHDLRKSASMIFLLTLAAFISGCNLGNSNNTSTYNLTAKRAQAINIIPMSVIFSVYAVANDVLIAGQGISTRNGAIIIPIT